MEHAAEREKFAEVVTHVPLGQRVKTGVSWYPLILKRHYWGLGNKMIVEVQRLKALNEVHLFQQGTVISFFCSQGDPKKEALQMPGVVLDVGENLMKIILHGSDWPEWLDQSGLGIDLRFDENSFNQMVEAMQTVLKAHESAKLKRLTHLREVLLGQEPPKISDENFKVESPVLNPAQIAAVTGALQAVDVGIIHGPPGTGKTTTLVEAIKIIVTREKQVLVCAPSNAAVDLLTEKLAAAGLNVLRMGHPARVDEKNMQHTLDGKLAKLPAYQLSQHWREEAFRIKSDARKYVRNFTPEKRRERDDKINEAKSMLNDARENEKKLVNGILDDAQVILSTLVGANSSLLEERKFKTVLIDEAAQALEPATWIPILRAGRVIFAGDHCQLPPTLFSVEAAKQGLAETLFEKTIKRHPQVGRLLNLQYRMNKVIMNFSNAQFYENQLQAHASVAEHNIDQAPLEFIDTAGTDFAEWTHPETRSISNEKEAELVLKHLDLLIPTLAVGQVSIGIVSPYKDQVNLLTEKIKAYAWYEKFQNDLSLGSVDGFQGQERDIIYISMVRCNEFGTIGFLSDTRRMNVAMTRARKKLVIFGDSSTLSKSKNKFYEDFLEYMETHGIHRSAWEF